MTTAVLFTVFRLAFGIFAISVGALLYHGTITLSLDARWALAFVALGWLIVDHADRP